MGRCAAGGLWGLIVFGAFAGVAEAQPVTVETSGLSNNVNQTYGRFYGSLDWEDLGPGIGSRTITRVETDQSRYDLDTGCGEYYWETGNAGARDCGYAELAVHFEPTAGLPGVLRITVYRGGVIELSDASYLQWTEARALMAEMYTIVQSIASNTCQSTDHSPQDLALLNALWVAQWGADQGSYPTFFREVAQCGPNGISGGGTVVNVQTFDPGVLDESGVESELEADIADLETDFEDVDHTAFDDVEFLDGRVGYIGAIPQTPFVEPVPLPFAKLGATQTTLYITDSTAAMGGMSPTLSAAVETYRTTFRAMLLAMWGGTLFFVSLRYFREM